MEYSNLPDHGPLGGHQECQTRAGAEHPIAVDPAVPPISLPAEPIVWHPTAITVDPLPSVDPNPNEEDPAPKR